MTSERPPLPSYSTLYAKTPETTDIPSVAPPLSQQNAPPISGPTRPTSIVIHPSNQTYSRVEKNTCLGCQRKHFILILIAVGLAVPLIIFIVIGFTTGLFINDTKYA